MNTIYFTDKNIAPMHDNNAIKLVITKDISEKNIRNMVAEMGKAIFRTNTTVPDTLYFAVSEDGKTVAYEGECYNGDIIFYNADKEED